MTNPIMYGYKRVRGWWQERQRQEKVLDDLAAEFYHLQKHDPKAHKYFIKMLVDLAEEHDPSIKNI